jgi:hypothetical protein
MKWRKGKGTGVSNGRGSGCAPHVQRERHRDATHPTSSPALPCPALVPWCPATVSTRLVLVLHFDYEAMCAFTQRRVFPPHGAADADAESTRADRILAFGASKTAGEPPSPLAHLSQPVPPLPPPSRPRTDTASAEEL